MPHLTPPETSAIPTQGLDLTRRERLAFWWRATGEIADLTRDREAEARVYDAAAVTLQPGAWHIAQFFRRRR